MKFNQNPYYNPTDCGLSIFESNDNSGSYEFNTFVIWRKLDDNSLWWDSDSGCSCPSPFDPSEDRHDLKPITKETFYNFHQALKNHSGIQPSDYNNILNHVKNHLNELGIKDLHEL